MLTQEDDVDAHALHRQGWTISAIARHLGHDRKTIRAYVKGDRVAGQRVSTVPDPFKLNLNRGGDRVDRQHQRGQRGLRSNLFVLRPACETSRVNCGDRHDHIS